MVFVPLQSYHIKQSVPSGCIRSHGIPGITRSAGHLPTKSARFFTRRTGSIFLFLFSYDCASHNSHYMTNIAQKGQEYMNPLLLYVLFEEKSSKMQQNSSLCDVNIDVTQFAEMKIDAIKNVTV